MSQRLNLLAPEVRENPYPFYAKLRRESPVCQVDPGGLWVISRHDDIIAAFKNTEIFSSTGLRLASEPPWLKRYNPMSDSMVVFDPPRHTKLRNLVTRAFTTSIVTRVESYARDVCQRQVEMLFERLFENDSVDFVSEFSLGVPAGIIGMLAGLDPSLQTKFKRWTDDILAAAATPPDDEVRLTEIRKSIDEMEHYLREVVERRRKKLGDDLVSDLINARVDGEALTEKETVAFLALMMVAGLDTTVYLLTHMAMILAQRPEWMDRLRGNEVLIPHFIEEVLRFEPPTHATFRLTTQDTELAGVKVPAQSTVLLMLGSALRDESQFEDPDTFKPERGQQSNIAFGHGIHFCLGSALARMEARVALDTLLYMCSRLELRTDRIQWNNSLNVRSPVTLPMKLIPA
jgi:cytochrome P450